MKRFFSIEYDVCNYLISSLISLKKYFIGKWYYSTLCLLQCSEVVVITCYLYYSRRGQDQSEGVKAGGEGKGRDEGEEEK